MTIAQKLKLILRINKAQTDLYSKKKQLIDTYIDQLHEYHKLNVRLDDLRTRVKAL